MNKNILYKKDLVSVIIPLYNSANYITPTIKSVLSQTYQNFEIILVDDYSKDNTFDVVSEFTKKDNRIKYFKQPVNKGAAEARNRGMDEATGQYIAFLDSDDLWNQDKLEKQLSFMKERNASFVYCAYDWVDENENLIKGKVKIKSQVEYKDLLTKTLISTPTVIFDRYILGDVRMPLRRTGQDYAFWLLLLRETYAFGIDEALVHVRRRTGSLSKNKFQNLRDIWETQTRLEGINKLSALYHILRYIFFTFKKRYL